MLVVLQGLTPLAINGARLENRCRRFWYFGLGDVCSVRGACYSADEYFLILVQGCRCAQSLANGCDPFGIEYVIPEKDQLRFLGAMSERRRIRRRDGALNWRLLRDLSDPELWIERYETPTWLDYLRLNNRMTRNDAVIPESLRALHRGPDGPRVRRMIERPAANPSTARAAGPESVSIAPD